jgi:hypothetical protein
MHERERYRTAIGEANTTGARGAAERINCDMPTGKSRSLRRAAAFIGLGFLLTTGFIVAIAVMPAQAEEGGGEVPKEMASLQAKVASLEKIVSTLQLQIASLERQLATVQSNPALALGPFVSVHANSENGVVGPHITLRAPIFILSAVPALQVTTTIQQALAI